MPSLTNPAAPFSPATGGRGRFQDAIKGPAPIIQNTNIDDFVVVQDHPDLLKFVDHLQRQNAEALSFYPMQVFERESEKGRIFLGLLNGHPCGYLYLGAGGIDVKCHQVCIQYDARRRLYGACLVACMEKYAEDAGAASLTLRCGFDLDANDFWQSLGYGVIAHQDGGIRRQRTINVWRKQLQSELFEPVYLEPARGEQDASLWAKHKQTGIVTQFVRGKRMRQYRAALQSLNNIRSDDPEPLGAASPAISDSFHG